MNIRKLIGKMTVEEKVMQLCTAMDHQLLDKGALSCKSMKQRLSKGIGFIASLTRDFQPRDGVEILNEAQRWLIENTRLGIPAIMHEECLHGCMSMGATIFPQSIAMAASWDLDLYARVAKAVGREARARGYTLALSPTINISRDARCGRVEEPLALKTSEFQFLGKKRNSSSVGVLPPASQKKGFRSRRQTRVVIPSLPSDP